MRFETKRKDAPPGKGEEHRIQSEFVSHVRNTAPDCVLHAPTNEASNRAWYDAGLLPGAPDVWIHWKGRCLCIEFKTPTGTVDDRQKAVHGRLRRAGVSVAVCRDVKTALRVWREWMHEIEAREERIITALQLLDNPYTAVQPDSEPQNCTAAKPSRQPWLWRLLLWGWRPLMRASKS